MGLIEVLASLIVLGTGVLGLGLLLLGAMRDARSASFRTRALALEADLADRIRANPEARAAYVFAAGQDPPSSQGCAARTGEPAVPCSAQALAQDDLADWLARVQHELPGGPGGPNAELSFESAESPDLDRYVLRLQWRDLEELHSRRSELWLAQGLLP